MSTSSVSVPSILFDLTSIRPGDSNVAYCRYSRPSRMFIGNSCPQTRNLSTKVNGSADGGGPPGSSTSLSSSNKSKRTGPIFIGQTPRSAAASKKPKQNNSKNEVNGTVPSNIDSDRLMNNIINGGVPSDPAPPPFQLANFGEESLYTLVLLRHGESEWNKLNRYTGWCDVELTEKGREEARDAGRLLYQNGIEIDHAFTSVLKRASFSCNMALNTAKQHWVPVTKTWRLNERHYGALQGYNKDTAYEELNLDQELVMQMRRSYDVAPPIMQDDHPYWHGNDRRYRKLSKEQLERSRAESLKDAADRIMPFFNSVVCPSLRSGNKCLVVCHANTIRTLIKNIDGISDEDIKSMSIPTGIPLLYRLDKNFKPVDPVTELEFRYMVEPKGYTWGTNIENGFHGVYLGDLERLQEIQRKRDVTNRNWQRIILFNIAKSLHSDINDEDVANAVNQYKGDRSNKKPSALVSLPQSKYRNIVLETRQLWWQTHNKMLEPEYGNMLLLSRMKDELEERMYQRKQKYITFTNYEELVHKLHLDAEGQIVEPFVELTEREDREERQRLYFDSLAGDLEEECLIR